MESTPPSPAAGRSSREERQQALLAAAERHVNPETGRFPADRVKEIYAELAQEFGLEPSSVATYLPSPLKPPSAEPLSYPRPRRSATAAQRREERAAGPAPAGVSPEPPAPIPAEPPLLPVPRRAGEVSSDLAQ